MLYIKKSSFSLGSNKENFQKEYHYSPSDAEEKHLGELFAVLEIAGGSSSEAIADTIFDALRESYYSMSGKDAGASFEKALREVNVALDNMIPRGKKGRELMKKINAILAVKSGSELHLTQSGQAEAYLMRDAKIHPVTDDLETESIDKGIFRNIASGSLQEDDRLFFATDKVSAMLARPELLRSLKLIEFEDLESEFADLLEPLLEDDRNLSMMFLEMGDSDEVDIPVKFLRPVSPASSWIEKLEHFVRSHLPTVKTFISDNFQKARSRADSMRRETDRKTATFAFGVMVITLLVAILVVWNQKSESGNLLEFQEKYNTLQEDVAKAERLLLYDKDSAQDLLLRATEDLTALKEQGRFRTQLEITESTINQAMDRVFNIDRVSPTLISDIDPDSPLAGLVFQSDNMFAFDSKSWHSIVLDESSAMPLVQADDLLFGDYSEYSDLTQIYTRSGQVVEVRGKNIGRPTIEGDIFPAAVDMRTYSRFTYFLDPTQNQLWKVRKNDDGSFQSPVSYLAEGVSVDLQDAVSLVIDGAVWILHSDGTITRLFRGLPEEFAVSGLPTQIQSPTRIFTTFDSPNLYILEGEARRITVIKKDSGKYAGSYILKGAGVLQDLYVSDESLKLYAIDESRLWSVDL